MSIAWVIVRLPTIKDHLKCAFLLYCGALGDQKSSQYLARPPFASRSATDQLRDQVVDCACGMLVHSSSMAVRICLLLSETETRCRTRRCSAPCKNWEVTCFQELCTDPWTGKTENNTCPKCLRPSIVSIWLLELVATLKLTSMQLSFFETAIQEI